MTILIIGGRPGSGKSTLVRKFLENFEGKTENVELAKLVKAVKVSSPELFVLGKYEEGEVFPGTDRLSMAVQPNALEWIHFNKGKKVIIEGDRLFNKKFLSSLSTLEDDVHVWILSCSEEKYLQRYEERGSNQSDSFLKGRKTKVDNVVDFCSKNSDINLKMFRNESPEDLKNLESELLTLMV